MHVIKSAAFTIFLVAGAAVGSSAQQSAQTSGPPARLGQQFARNIRPLLERHCTACHGATQQKAMLRLDSLEPSFTGSDGETWHDVLNKVSRGEMPPEDQPAMDTASRRALLDWIRKGIDRAARERKGGSRGTVLRRLTRYEYNNTLKDLLGINLDFARDLPREPSSADGFRNNGESLGMSPLQIEYYLQAARLAMDKAIVEGPAPRVHKHRFDKSSAANGRRNQPISGNRMPPHGRFLGRMLEFPRAGEFVVRVKAGSAIPDGMGVPRMQVSLGLRSDTQSPSRILAAVDVPNVEANKKVYEFRGRMEDFPLPGHNPKFPGVTITVSNVYDDGLPPPKTGRVKAIPLTGDQKKQTRAAARSNVPKLPTSDAKTRRGKSGSAFIKAANRLQQQIEELRLIPPDHKNQTDLAYRLFDVDTALRKEQKLVQAVATALGEPPDEFMERYRTTNAAALADRTQVRKRFDALTPIDRRSGKRAGAPPEQPRSTLVVDYVEFEGPLFESWPPRSHTRLLPQSKGPEREQALSAIKAFLSSAYRRPISDTDVEPIIGFYDEIRPASRSFEEAMRESLAMALISPEFLYLVEPVGEASRSLSQHELASRLSYFLWSTMPDDRLRELAKIGRLSDTRVLDRQIRAMISDPRSSRFVQYFTDQWLDLSGLDRVAVNPEYYPDFNDRLKPLMRKETQAFFAEILHNDLSAMNFIDSEFAMLNEPLARHYGIRDSARSPRGGEFQRVSLRPEDGRGGLLTQGSFLMINSTGEDSHPIRRAVWVLDRLLNDPPPPPPPDVPPLDEDSPDSARLPLKQRLEQHRNREACNDCHRAIDPWGVAFESFDAVGLRRESVLRKVGRRSQRTPVDDNATLPGGERLRGVDGLKQYLLQHERDRFARAFVSKLLTYALGRSLSVADQPTVDSLASTFAESNYRLSDLIVAIVQSQTFQSK